MNMVNAEQNSLRVGVAAEKYSLMLRKIAFTYLRSVPDAEDTVQEVMLAYFRQAPEFSSEEHERAWLIRVTVNKSLDLCKALRHRNHSELPEYLSVLPPEQSEVFVAVLSLDPKYRLPVHLHYYEGYSIAEIAAILKTKPATVGTWLARGRSQLKQILGGNENGYQ